jgi:hypothetical protein
LRPCRNCLLDLSLYPPLEGGRCPNCGTLSGGAGIEAAAAAAPPPVAPVGPGAPMVLLSRFWNTLKEVIFRPSAFYSAQGANIVAEGGLSTALAFAVIVQWLASFFNFIWRSTVGVMIEDRMGDLFQIAGDVMQGTEGMGQTIEELRSRAVEFLFGAGAVVLTPFTTLIKLAIVALFVHAAVRFFTKESAGRPQSYSATLKILAYATGPWILCVIPGVGVLLAWILAFFAAVIGVREVYRTTTGRATLAVVFPELLFLTFVFGAILLVVFLAFNVMRLVF